MTVDHRAIKRRCAPMLGFKSFASGRIILAGIELAHRIRKGQFSFMRGRNGASLKQLWDMALADGDAPPDRKPNVSDLFYFAEMINSFRRCSTSGSTVL